MRLLLILLFLSPMLLFAQTDIGIKAEYISQDKKSNRVQTETYLFSKNAALGKVIIPPQNEPVIETDENGNLNAEVRLGSNQEEHQLYHYDYKKNLWTSKLFIADEYFIVYDSIPPFKWEITSDTKVIAGYSCFAANMHFRGRDYTAYFTPEIPFSSGPYKFGGLPGLILEIQTADGNFGWYCKSIAKAGVTELNSIVKPTGKRPISFQEYRNESIAFIYKAVERLRNSTNLTVESDPVFNEEDWLEIPEKQ